MYRLKKKKRKKKEKKKKRKLVATWKLEYGLSDTGKVSVIFDKLWERIAFNCSCTPREKREFLNNFRSLCIFKISSFTSSLYILKFINVIFKQSNCYTTRKRCCHHYKDQSFNAFNDSGVPRGVGVSNPPSPPRNSEGPPKSCQTQPHCENC